MLIYKSITPDNYLTKIEFTDILYGVIISIAISKLTLDLSLNNVMLFFALLIIFDDWLDYHISLSLVKLTPKKYFLGYILDIAILLNWYLITIIPSHTLRIYLLFVALFFFLAGIWDVFVKRVILKKFIKSPYFQLFIIYSILLGFMYVFTFSGYILIGICTTVFVIVKIPAWKRLLDEASIVFKERKKKKN